MNAQAKQVRKSYTDYSVADVEPYRSGFAIRIIAGRKGSKPIFGHVSYTSGSVFVWDSHQAACDFLADALEGL